MNSVNLFLTIVRFRKVAVTERWPPLERCSSDRGVLLNKRGVRLRGLKEVSFTEASVLRELSVLGGRPPQRGDHLKFVFLGRLSEVSLIERCPS